MRLKWTHRVHWTIHNYNKGACESCLPIHYVKKVHKVNKMITSPRHGYLPEHVPIKNGISSDLSPVAIILGPPKSRLQQVKNHIGIIWKCLHRYHWQHQAKNSRSDFTAPIKQIGQILFHVARHWKTAPHTHMERATNQWTGNTEGGWTCYKVNQP